MREESDSGTPWYDCDMALSAFRESAKIVRAVENGEPVECNHHYSPDDPEPCHREATRLHYSTMQLLRDPMPACDEHEPAAKTERIVSIENWTPAIHARHYRHGVGELVKQDGGGSLADYAGGSA